MLHAGLFLCRMQLRDGTFSLSVMRRTDDPAIFPACRRSSDARRPSKPLTHNATAFNNLESQKKNKTSQSRHDFLQRSYCSHYK
jgi:hypothetical protein